MSRNVNWALLTLLVLSSCTHEKEGEEGSKPISHLEQALASRSKTPIAILPRKQPLQAFTKLTPEIKASLDAQLTHRLLQIRQAYSRKDRLEHARATLGFLRFSGTIPIYHLTDFTKHLLESAEQQRTSAAFSILIDLGYRFGKYGTKYAIPMYERLGRAAMRVEDDPANPAKLVFLRSRNGSSFAAYDLEIGHAVGRLMFSGLGLRQISRNYRPETFLVIVDRLRGCKKVSSSVVEADSTLNSWGERDARVGACVRLERELARNLEKKDLASLAVGDDVWGKGAPLSTTRCALGDGPISQQLDFLEAYQSCRDGGALDVLRGWDIGSAMQGEPEQPEAYGEPIGTAPWEIDEDGNWQPSESEGSRGGRLLGPDYLFVGSTTTGEEVPVDIYVHLMPAVSEPGTNNSGSATGFGAIIHESNGGFTVQKTDPSGRMTYSAQYDNRGTQRNATTYGSNGSVTHRVEHNQNGQLSYEQFENGDSYSAEYNDNGTLKSETIIESGQATVVTYDEHGNQTSSSATTPPDDLTPSYSTCSTFMTDGISSRRFDHLVTRLETQIIPGPESVEGVDSCLAGGVRGTSGPRRCRSVAMCADGYAPNENCVCSVATQATRPPTRSSCDRSFCESGSTCNPATGGCVTGGGSSVPGFGPGPAPYPIQTGTLGWNADPRGSSVSVHTQAEASRIP